MQTQLQNDQGKRFTLKGISEEVETCMHCGRTGLRRTVALEPSEGGEIVFFGTTCAAHALRWTDGRKVTEATIKSAEAQRQAAERAAAAAARLAPALPILRALQAQGAFPHLPPAQIDFFPFIPPAVEAAWDAETAARFAEARELVRNS